MIIIRRELIGGDDHFDEIESTNKSLIKDKKQKSDNPIILVTGDSWAAGEWISTDDPDKEFNHRVIHSMAAYLEQLYECTTVYYPNPGWHDYESVLACNTYADSCDYIIYFKTCPLRVFNMRGPVEISLDMWDEGNIYQIAHDVNCDIYRHLKPYEEKMILFGGLTKICEWAQDYMNCFDIYPSVLELFDNKVQDTPIMGFENMWEVFVDKKYRDSLLELMETFARKKEYMKKRPQHYFPDNLHPNQITQQKLAIMIGDKYFEKRVKWKQ